MKRLWSIIVWATRIAAIALLCTFLANTAAMIGSRAMHAVFGTDIAVHLPETKESTPRAGGSTSGHEP